MSRPRPEAEYISLAASLADTGEFYEANAIRALLNYWPETSRWWSGDLACSAEESMLQNPIVTSLDVIPAWPRRRARLPRPTRRLSYGRRSAESGLAPIESVSPAHADGHSFQRR